MARLRNHVEVLLGHRRASEINPGDIETIVADITAGKTAKDEKVAPRQRVISVAAKAPHERSCATCRPCSASARVTAS
jgi:hypothetical protein